MKFSEKELKKLKKEFIKLPLRKRMTLPACLLTPKIPDDGTRSISYMNPLEVSVRRGKILMIEDGNHRYYDRKRRCEKEGKPFDEETFDVIKWYPYPTK